MFLSVCAYIFVSILCLHFVSEVKCREMFESSLGYMDVTVVKNNLWVPIVTENLGMCAKKCAFVSDCRAFSYNRISKDCWGHSEFYTTESGKLIPDPGTQYFNRKIYVKPTTIQPTTEAITKKSPKGQNGNKKADVSDATAVSTIHGSTLGQTTAPKSDDITSEPTSSLLQGQFTTETSTAS
ncbi:uncharacterized protein LOC134231309 [Saccostrea cucullata]|uniref:uncharacterized protein LOC134231309 n=1 Tax=Saccostrea cuccullata TaxID=36930 RepID=UPI002ED117A3